MADRRLQVFHAVARQLSFTKAAEALFMTQPAVTFQIKQLEEHFNARLFERGHGVGKSVAEAVKWYQRAAESGDVVSQFKLGLIYADKARGASLKVDERTLSLLRTLRNQAIMAFKQSAG